MQFRISVRKDPLPKFLQYAKGIDQFSYILLLAETISYVIKVKHKIYMENPEWEEKNHMTNSSRGNYKIREGAQYCFLCPLVCLKTLWDYKSIDFFFFLGRNTNQLS